MQQVFSSTNSWRLDQLQCHTWKRKRKLQQVTSDDNKPTSIRFKLDNSCSRIGSRRRSSNGAAAATGTSRLSDSVNEAKGDKFITERKLLFNATTDLSRDIIKHQQQQQQQEQLSSVSRTFSPTQLMVQNELETINHRPLAAATYDLNYHHRHFNGQESQLRTNTAAGGLLDTTTTSGSNSGPPTNRRLGVGEVRGFCATSPAGSRRSSNRYQVEVGNIPPVATRQLQPDPSATSDSRRRRRRAVPTQHDSKSPRKATSTCRQHYLASTVKLKKSISSNDNNRHKQLMNLSIVAPLLLMVILTFSLPSVTPAGVGNDDDEQLVAAASSSSASLSSPATTASVSDPRPTIYSGQVSFGLLLSAHSTLGGGGGVELSTSANQPQVAMTTTTTTTATTLSRLLESLDNNNADVNHHDSALAAASTPQSITVTAGDGRPLTAASGLPENIDDDAQVQLQAVSSRRHSTTADANASVNANTTTATPRTDGNHDNDDDDDDDKTPTRQPVASESMTVASRVLAKRQIFERPSRGYQTRRQQAANNNNHKSSNQLQQQQKPLDHTCGQVNPGALYAGMGAIWASHQANLVGDSQLTIGTYIYDSCNDLEVGQRQSVRIVSNLNAFQQTTCELPRGSPISLTIAHGDNQLRAIQLLTSFRVPVITTKEHFALEDYQQLNRNQRQFLFSTAPSSRHLALGALRFTRRVVARSISSAKLPNQFHKLSPKNGLIVISRNLPARFLAYLSETIPIQVNYEMLQSSQPIEQVRSIESLESVLIRSAVSSSSSSLSSGESRLVPVTISRGANANDSKIRQPRQTLDDSDSPAYSSSSSSPDSGGNGDETIEQQRMLSPTILMFITPAEAIDLVTRLRNDLAEVSKYYSLIVATREDISPALRTIFHRGGSRLCSGKSFYTISPVSEDIGEFSRYFRDTVQMEGESSDHPLITEFARHQSTSRLSPELDDTNTEPVIKAVWTAASAFKLVHRRECGTTTSSSSSNVNTTGGGGGSGTRSVPSEKHGRQSSTSGGGAHGKSAAGDRSSDCMIKMNKNMSNLVQKSLKRLDVTVNSTGLQALDGFRIKFDEVNELLTNKFSIKYINKECEIIEIGQYSGLKESALDLDEDILLKSLESALPDPWPVQSQPASSTTTTTRGGSGSMMTLNGQSAAASGTLRPSNSASNQDDAPSESGTTQPSANAIDEQQSTSSSPGGGGGGGSGEDGGESESPSVAGDTNEPTKNPVGRFEATQASEPRKNRRPQAPFGAGAAIGSHGKVARRQKKPNGGSGSRQRKQVLVSGTGEAETLPPTTTISSVDTNGDRNEPTVTIKHLDMSTISGQAQAKTTTRPMRKLKAFPMSATTNLKDWLPRGSTRATFSLGASSSAASDQPVVLDAETPNGGSGQQSGEMQQQQMSSSTTRAPIYSTLPESGGNTDLDMPAFKRSSEPTAPTATTINPITQSPTTSHQPPPTAATNHHRSLDTSASATVAAESADYVTLAPLHATLGRLNQLSQELRYLNSSPIPLAPHSPSSKPIGSIDGQKLQLLLDDDQSMRHSSQQQQQQQQQQQGTPGAQQNLGGRSKFRSHLKWIQSSWFALTILGANICGALFTLYVLTFLLMKNCDGSLDRENQGIRSMHLLAIIAVFFGSTLFIVYPNPGLCLIRTSWHNFALVLLFGTLLLQTMQIRSINSLGLGGRPNRLNQFLTLVFMVGVQVSFELQRWRYESPNYLNFVNQYFGSSESGDKRLMQFSSTVATMAGGAFETDPQIGPISLLISEKYQSLLQDYCSQSADSFLQSQIYIWIIISLLVLFGVITKRQGHLQALTAPKTIIAGVATTRAHHKQIVSSPKDHPRLSATLMSGQGGASGSAGVGANNNNNNGNSYAITSPSQYQFSPNIVAPGGSPLIIGHHHTNHHHHHLLAGTSIGNVFLVTVISAPIYFISVILHTQDQQFMNQDLISSLTMVLIAFTTLMGIFLPILHHVQHRFDGLLLDHHHHRRQNSSSTGTSSCSASSNPLVQTKTNTANYSTEVRRNKTNKTTKTRQTKQIDIGDGAFAMFPEFAPTGLRRPASLSGDSSSGSRKPFAETRESRKNLSVVLANLGPSIGSLRNLGLGGHRKQLQQQQQQQHHHHQQQHQLGPATPCGLAPDSHPIDPALLNLKLNLTPDDELAPMVDHEMYHQYNQHEHQRAATPRELRPSSTGGEKRLIMLDVDPCCPRHGLGAASSGSAPKLHHQHQNFHNHSAAAASHSNSHQHHHL